MSNSEIMPQVADIFLSRKHLDSHIIRLKSGTTVKVASVKKGVGCVVGDKLDGHAYSYPYGAIEEIKPLFPKRQARRIKKPKETGALAIDKRVINSELALGSEIDLLNKD